LQRLYVIEWKDSSSRRIDIDVKGSGPGVFYHTIAASGGKPRISCNLALSITSTFLLYFSRRSSVSLL